MAIARATCRCAKCGRTFEVRATKANRRDADSFEDWASRNIDECPECRDARIQAEHDAENAKAAQAAEERDLPTLTGSEKQVAWATTIRQNLLTEWAKTLDEADFDPNKDAEAIRIFREAIGWYTANETKASWWIDRRKDALLLFAREYVRKLEAGEIRPSAAEDLAEAELREVAQEEATVAPAEQTHAGVVDIAVTDTAVSAAYSKDDDFRALVKGLGYRWDGDAHRWTLKLGATTGSGAERAAELGNKLLNAGFAVRIADPDTRRAAVEGRYSPQTGRWITYHPDRDLLRIVWDRDDDLYRQAKAIAGAKYDKPGVTVPTSQWQQVLDFAQIYDYRISPGALKAIERAKAAVTVVTPAPAKQTEYRETDIAAILDSDPAVLEDLRDDP